MLTLAEKRIQAFRFEVWIGSASRPQRPCPWLFSKISAVFRAADLRRSARHAWPGCAYHTTCVRIQSYTWTRANETLRRHDYLNGNARPLGRGKLAGLKRDDKGDPSPSSIRKIDMNLRRYSFFTVTPPTHEPGLSNPEVLPSEAWPSPIYWPEMVWVWPTFLPSIWRIRLIWPSREIWPLMVFVTPVPASVSQVETPVTSPVSEMVNCQVDLYSTSQGAGHTVTSQVSSLPNA